jgi:ketosteroid isomerase-like protein
MRVTPRGISYGRAAIEKDLVETFKVTSNIADKVEKVQVAGEVVLVTATWSATLQNKDGPIQVRGFWGGFYVRDGDIWKTRLAIVNRALPPPQQETKQ